MGKVKRTKLTQKEAILARKSALLGVLLAMNFTHTRMRLKTRRFDLVLILFLSLQSEALEGLEIFESLNIKSYGNLRNRLKHLCRMQYVECVMIKKPHPANRAAAYKITPAGLDVVSSFGEPFAELLQILGNVKE